MANDNDHRRVANHVLFTANKVVTTERGGQHGGAEDSFQMIADLWSTYLRNTKYNFAPPDGLVAGVIITPKDVAQMMVLLKIARNAHGMLKEDDFVDQAGYTALAAALGGVTAPEPELPKVTPVLDTTANPKADLGIQRGVDASTKAMAQKLAPVPTTHSKVVEPGQKATEVDPMASAINALEQEIKA